MSILSGMGKIRSAWEIALEKTASIELDKEKYQHDADVDKARRIAGSYLVSDDRTEEDMKNELSALDPAVVKEALSMTVLNALSLPQEEILDDRYEKIAVLADIASSGNAAVADLIGQITAFLKQYPLHRKELVDKMKEQFAPMLEEKEERMRAQYGQNVKLRIENDKDFLDMASKNLERLQDQYEKTLEGAKEQLKALLS